MIGRFSQVMTIKPIEVAILEYLRDCADMPSRGMWQRLTHIKRNLEGLGFETAKISVNIRQLMLDPPCIKWDSREPDLKYDEKIYRITREGRMVLLDIENGELVPIKERKQHGLKRSKVNK